jgi:hypothetical protein
MTLFLTPIRRIRRISGTAPTAYPTSVMAAITFGPGDAFGVSGGDLRTTVGIPNTANLSGNLDEGSIELSGGLIQKIEADFHVDAFRVQVNGNILTFSFAAVSYDHARQVLNSALQLLPPILTLRLQVYVWVKLCEVRIGEERSNLILSQIDHPVTATTNELSTDSLRHSIAEWLSTKKEHLSLLSAYSYFRQAKRLAAIQPCPEPFVSEIVLNLAKAIEIIFRTKSHEIVRERARDWKYALDEVEEFLIPILILRSNVDVAHPALTQLTIDQRSTAIQFSFSAIRHVEMFLLHVAAGVQAGTIHLDGPSLAVDRDKSQFLERIAQYLKKGKHHE